MQQQKEKKREGLSARLFELRGNMSQTSFSAQIGVIQQTYAQWEIGSRQPKIQELIRLAQHFEVSVDWLLGLSDQRYASQSEVGDNNLQSRLLFVEKELCRYKSAFVKITNCLKSTTEVIEELNS